MKGQQKGGGKGPHSPKPKRLVKTNSVFANRGKTGSIKEKTKFREEKTPLKKEVREKGKSYQGRSSSMTHKRKNCNQRKLAGEENTKKELNSEEKGRKRKVTQREDFGLETSTNRGRPKQSRDE